MKTKSFMKGAFIASLVAGGAAYFLNKGLSKETKSDVKKAVSGLTKNILDRMKTLKGVSQMNFESVVDAAIDEYGIAKKMSKDTTGELRRELKSQWKAIEKELKGMRVAQLAPKKKKARR